MPTTKTFLYAVFFIAISITTCIVASADDANASDAAQQAQAILEASGLKGGLIVLAGDKDGRLTTALSEGPIVIQSLTRSEEELVNTRDHINEQGLAGRVTTLRWNGSRLPYADNLVNLLVVTEGEQVDRDETMRVLAPGGTVYVIDNEKSTIETKPRPSTIDDWTHYLYGPDNNAVSKDTEVGPPRYIQWIRGPRFSRTHDHLASMSAMVSANGRVFYIVDETSAAFAGATADWKLIACDAFNGVQLWKRDIDKWEYHLRDFRSGPADIARRLVAVGDRVYVTLGYGEPVTAIDAATGELLHTYEGTQDATEILVDDGTLLIAAGEQNENWRFDQAKAIVSQTDYVPPFEDVTPPTHDMRVMALDAASGEILWRNEEPYVKTLMPATLTSSDGSVYFETPERIVCLEGSSGQASWNFPRSLQRTRLAWSSPTLVVRDGVVYSADRRAADAAGALLWMPSGGFHEYIKGPDAEGELIALDAASGEQLWNCEAYEGFNAAVDVLISDDVLWTGNYAWGDGPGITQGRDPLSGDVVRTRAPDQELMKKIGHARCHRAKATDKYLILGRRGVEWVDVKTGELIANRFVRRDVSVRRDAGQRSALRPAALVRLLDERHAQVRFPRFGAGPKRRR